jgi:hypothetical protein
MRTHNYAKWKNEGLKVAVDYVLDGGASKAGRGPSVVQALRRFLVPN